MRLAFMAAGVAFLLARSVSGQGFAPQAPGGPDINNLAHRMAEQVQHLAEDIRSDLAQNPAGRHLLQDTQELAQAVEEFHATVHNNPDMYRARQTFSGIEGTWQHLRAQLSQPGVTTTAVDRAARQVELADAQLRQALNLNAPPPGYYGNAPVPTGLGETRRLAHAMVDRADQLAAAIRYDLATNPNGTALAQDADALARAADAFHDTIDDNQPIQVAAQAFGPVDVIADRLERYVTTSQVPPRVQSAWQGFASVEVLIHQNLGLTSAQPVVQYSLQPAGGGPSPIIQLSDQLAGQAVVFVQTFAPFERQVHDGDDLLEDARRFQGAAARFRQNAAGGLDPGRLANEFRDVDAHWRRVARRVNRIAQNRPGPFVQQAEQIGQSCEQIHRVLGIPGYSPAFIVTPNR